MRAGFWSTARRPGASYDVKEGDVLTINLGAREVRAQVVSVQEVVAKNDAALLYKLLP